MSKSEIQVVLVAVERAAELRRSVLDKQDGGNLSKPEAETLASDFNFTQ